MNGPLRNKRALGTGGSRAIGAAIVRRRARDGDLADTLRALLAVPRQGSTDEIAALVAYLAGPEAGVVTGASLTIDGGCTA